jgi:hypothetical protein
MSTRRSLRVISPFRELNPNIPKWNFAKRGVKEIHE